MESVVIVAEAQMELSLREEAIRELEHAPEALLPAVIDFLRFLKEKAVRTAGETASLSESVLAREWLTAEEEEAWSDL